MQKNKSLLTVLKSDFPDINFIEGPEFMWSPKYNKIIYDPKQTDNTATWALFHEIAHAQLGHNSFSDDFYLLQLELEAWEKAKLTAQTYSVIIDPEHIEDCLDTYRDWLHLRATCPKCSVVSLQLKSGAYSCFNCKTVWRVPKSQSCKVTRRIIKE